MQFKEAFQPDSPYVYEPSEWLSLHISREMMMANCCMKTWMMVSEYWEERWIDDFIPQMLINRK